MGLVEGDDLEQLRLQAPADQVPLEALDRRQAVLHPRSRRVEERVRAVEEDPAVLLAGLVEDVDVVAEILLDDGLRVAAAPPAGAWARASAHLLDGAQPVKQHRQLGAAVGDRARAVLALAVEVDGLGQHVDGAGHEVGGDDDGDVLVEHADGEREPVPSQNARRHSLFCAIRSLSSHGKRVTCVARRGREKARLRNAAGHRRMLSKRWMFPVAKSEPVRSSDATRRAIAAGGSASSESTNISSSPPAARRRVARRAEARVLLAHEDEARIAAATRSAIAAEPSGEPSSTITTSRSPNVCARSDARHSPR